MALSFRTILYSFQEIWNDIYDEPTHSIKTTGGTGGGAGIQYADGTTAATPTGTAVTWNDSGVERVASAAKPLPVATAPLTAALDTVTVVQDSNSTAALTQVASSITSVTVLAANANRKEALIFNNSTANLFLAFTGTAATTAFTVKLAAGTAYALPTPLYKGVISGIWDAANGTAQVTEY